MMNQKPKKWEAQSWIPKKQQLQSHKRKDKPKTESKKQRRKIRIKNVNNDRAKVKFDNKKDLIDFGIEVQKSRKRTERPKMLDTYTNPKIWEYGPYKERAINYTKTLVAYYQTDEVKEMIRKRNEASGNYISPADTQDYKDILNYLILREKAGVSEETDKEMGVKIRRWLSNKVSIQEFEQAYKVFEKEEGIISKLWSNSDLKETLTLKEYKSSFYGIFRDMLQKTKSQYDSDTIRTYMFSNGIDDVVNASDFDEENELSDEKLDEIGQLINPKIGQTIDEVKMMRALMEGLEPKTTERLIKEPKERHTKSNEKSTEELMSPDTDWFNYRPPENVNYDYFKFFYRKGDFKNKELSEISDMFPTKGELKYAQEIMFKATKRFSDIEVGLFEGYTMDFYRNTYDIISAFSDNKEMQNKSLLADKLYEYTLRLQNEKIR